MPAGEPGRVLGKMGEPLRGVHELPTVRRPLESREWGETSGEAERPPPPRSSGALGSGSSGWERRGERGCEELGPTALGRCQGLRAWLHTAPQHEARAVGQGLRPGRAPRGLRLRARMPRSHFGTRVWISGKRPGLATAVIRAWLAGAEKRQTTQRSLVQRERSNDKLATLPWVTRATQRRQESGGPGDRLDPCLQ